ncbi:MAG: hypothetical protein KKA42_06565, partial [candidate division Zixibacteria bacterium]|nr:hypothetical protein [candidate division Zixibacteria bacterium]
ISFGMLSGDVEFVGVFILAISTLLIPITTLGTVGGGVLLYSGKLIIAFVVGHAIISTVRKETPRLGKGALLLGLALFYIISEIPYLGFAVQVFGAIVGAGAIILGIKHCQQKHLPLLAGKPSNNAIASGDQ